jgi:hypothetical protein
VGLLGKVFSPEVIDAAVDAAGVREQRDRKLPARLMVMFCLGMWLWPNSGYVRVLREISEGLRWAWGVRPVWVLPSDGSITNARKRLTSAPFELMFTQVAGVVSVAGDEGAFRFGRRLVATDGTVFDLADTAANRAEFAVPSGGAFPQARLVALAECGGLSLIGAVFDSIAVGERELFERLLGHLDSTMLLLADRGFPSYELWRKACATGAALAWRVSASFALPVREVLSDGSYLSEVCGTRAGERVTVRVVEYSVKGEDGVSEVFALITTLLDPDEAPALELAAAYADRWRIEVLYDTVKVEIRAGRSVCRSKHPDTSRQELWALLCVYQGLHRLVVRAARAARIDPGRISVLPVLDAVRRSVVTAFSP